MGVFLNILVWVMVILTVVMALTFVLSWYESANEEPALMTIRFRPGSLLLAARLVGYQTCAVLWSLILRPAGWFMGREEPSQNNHQTPIILLHGLFQNPGCLLPLKRRLRLSGFFNIHTVSLSSWHNAEYLTEQIARKVDELRHATGFSKVHLIGHSMGGILARNYIQIRGGERKVASCILIGTPNQGSRMAVFALSPLGRLLPPRGEFVPRLAAAPLPPQIPFLSIYSRHDNLILPAQNAFLKGAVNIELKGLGHTALLFSGQVHHDIINFLRRLPS